MPDQLAALCRRYFLGANPPGQFVVQDSDAAVLEPVTDGRL
jgi:hypothetical protein